MDKVNWCNCDSRRDMEARLSSVDGMVFEILLGDEPYTWGYLAIEYFKRIFVPIGFTHVGLSPQVCKIGERVIVGVSEILAGYELNTGKLRFRYRMPTVFHDFVSSDERGFVVQDEIGFIGLSYDGNERWIELYNDNIKTYRLENGTISGETVEGRKFKIENA